MLTAFLSFALLGLVGESALLYSRTMRDLFAARRPPDSTLQASNSSLADPKAEDR